MAYVKKVYTQYTDCESRLTFELPAILTEQGILISHLRYLAWFNRKSQSWKERSIYSLRLLLEYLNSVSAETATSITQHLKGFSENIIAGTINLKTLDDPSGLFWRSRSTRDANSILFHITHYTDFLALQDDYQSERANPFRVATRHEERLNWCAYYHKQQNVFLNHLSDQTSAKAEASRVRLVGNFVEQKIDNQKVTRFPEEHLERLLYLGFSTNNGTDYRSQAMTMLLNYGGLRKSELFHIYVSDITQHPTRPDEALVRVYHPEYGRSPDQSYKNRKEYLAQETEYKPRTQYQLSERLYAGWKAPLLTSKEYFFEVVFSPPEKAKDFLSIWVNYLKFQRADPASNDPHPFAFTNDRGKPDTLKNFQRRHRNAVERIGLECAKELGTTEHCHRHSYGYRLRQYGLDQISIQKAMHHKSPMSCLVYIKPTDEEVRAKMKEFE